MGIFDIFRKRKPIAAPWSKYYTDEELNIKIPNISLYKQVVNSSESYPDFLAYKYLGRKVTYKKFVKQIDKAAIAFKKLNVKKGDIVTICLPNIPESLIAFYALNKLGAIANMLHPLSADTSGLPPSVGCFFPLFQTASPRPVPLPSCEWHC